ncbi:MAG: DNA translocase FtsK [Amoebophilaceae bacterium]|nr:DNA translocase FtsK [Amoebophilaceae bacterium]
MAKNNYKIQEEKASDQNKEPYTVFNLDQRVKISLGLFLQGVAIFLALAFVSHFIHGGEDQCIIESIQALGFTKNPLVANWLGVIGAFISYYFVHRWWGITAFFFLPFLFLVGLKWVMPKRYAKLSLFKFMLASIFLILWSNLLIGYLNLLYPNTKILTQQLGGIAYELSLIFNHLLGYGTLLLLFITLLSFFVIYFNITSLPSFACLKLFAKKKTAFEQPTAPLAEEALEVAIEAATKEDKAIDFEVVHALSKEQPKPLSPLSVTSKGTLPKPSLENICSENYDPTLDLSNYQYPRLDLLEPYTQDSSAVTQEELEMNKNNIIETLNNFKINIVKIKATIGPTVTLYEIVPEAGVKISKIKNLEDDIALNLAALGIRIIAPIPGKGTIGIEVPNKNREMVPLQQVLACEKFLKGTMDLPVVLGKSISNEMVIADLARMPHLLIAGATGQGKSVGLNVILTSLIYKKHPSQLKLVLVDPKKVELSLYNKLEHHFLAKLPATEEAIITETKKVIHTLNSLCIEMDHRYELLKEAGTRNIREYNEKFIKRVLQPKEGHRFLPYIVLVIDEFADMMMTAGKEIEVPIARLAQLARAIGIHLVLATQRPSVNVITGIIKANFPVRISYKVSSKIDARTILDSSGAEQLVGNGDMLLSMNSDIIRLQGPFLDTAEVERVCSYIGNQPGYQTAYMLPIYDEEEQAEGSEVDLQELDTLFEEAAKLVVLHQQGSTSLIQRKLKLGYNRSGRIIDQLEAAGVVGPFEGSKAREVLVADEASLEEILTRLHRKN